MPTFHTGLDECVNHLVSFVHVGYIEWSIAAADVVSTPVKAFRLAEIRQYVLV